MQNIYKYEYIQKKILKACSEKKIYYHDWITRKFTVCSFGGNMINMLCIWFDPC